MTLPYFNSMIRIFTHNKYCSDIILNSFKGIPTTKTFIRSWIRKHQQHLLQHQLYFYYRCYLYHFRQYATLTLHIAFSYTMIHYHQDKFLCYILFRSLYISDRFNLQHNPRTIKGKSYIYKYIVHNLYFISFPLEENIRNKPHEFSHHRPK